MDDGDAGGTSHGGNRVGAAEPPPAGGDCPACNTARAPFRVFGNTYDVGTDGLSALLVSTSKQMPLCVQELDKRGLQFPVLIGLFYVIQDVVAQLG